MDNQKITFIVCSDSELCYEECLGYIDRLRIPDGYEIDVICITGADSMTEAYNAAMESSDAKYKIYLHQDVFILYPYFLYSLVEIFQVSSHIGMIGMAGTDVFPEDYMMWSQSLVGNICSKSGPPCDYKNYRYKLEDNFSVMDAIDGLLIATSYDIPWRTDLLDGWDF